MEIPEMTAAVKIKRGELYYVNWNPARGSEQAGIKPALIIQNDIGNQYSPTTIVAACTTATVKDYPFIVRIGSKESGLSKDSAVNLSSIFTVDKTRLKARIGELPASRLKEVDDAIRESLGLSE